MVHIYHCFPKWAVPPPWGRCFDIGGAVSGGGILCLILLFSISKKSFDVITKGYCQDQIKCLQGDEIELVYYIIVSKYIFSL